jgi:hypothetical protein
MKTFRQIQRALVLGLGLAAAAGAAAHHSYAMFDGARLSTVTGSVAKLEWTNPHVFLWVYVPSSSSATGYDLYAFENGSPNVLAQRGWSKTSFAPGDPIAVTYWPLTDGRTGGHFAVATRADGSVMRGAGGPGGSPDASATGEAPPAPRPGQP